MNTSQEMQEHYSLIKNQLAKINNEKMHLEESLRYYIVNLEIILSI
jgi:hypothetical protein